MWRDGPHLEIPSNILAHSVCRVLLWIRSLWVSWWWGWFLRLLHLHEVLIDLIEAWPMFYCARSHPFLHHRLCYHLIQYCLRIHWSVIWYCHLRLKNLPLGALRPSVAQRFYNTALLSGYLANFLRKWFRADINGARNKLMHHQALSLLADKVNGLIIEVTIKVAYRLLIYFMTDPLF